MGSPFFILLFWFILFLKGKLSPVHLRAAAASGSYYWLMMNRLQSSGHCGCVDGASFWSRSRCSIVISGPHNSSFNTTPLSLSLSILFVFDVIKAVGNLIIASAAGRDSALFHSRAWWSSIISPISFFYFHLLYPFFLYSRSVAADNSLFVPYNIYFSLHPATDRLYIYNM